MNVLFDVVHPAQVHFFKNVIRKLKSRGDNVQVTSREKDVTVDLLNASNIEHVTISRKGKGLWGMGLELLSRDIKLLRLVGQFQPDVMVSRVGVSIGPVGKLVGIPTVVYDDMEHARLQATIGMTFATYICTGLGYYRDFGKRHVRFKGLHVLSYLSPDYYEPDPHSLLNYGVDPAKPYIFIRMVSWGAAHDAGKAGLSESQLQKMISSLREKGRIIISSENPLPSDLKEFENPVPIENVFDLMAFARLCLVESGSMAAEAAALGIPTIAINTFDFQLGYLKALEKQYGLLFQPKTLDEIVEITDNLLSQNDMQQSFQTKRQKLLAESEDVVQFQLDMIEKTVFENPR